MRRKKALDRRKKLRTAYGLYQARQYLYADFRSGSLPSCGLAFQCSCVMPDPEVSHARHGTMPLPSRSDGIEQRNRTT
jgi:hypothetical protein